MPARSGGGVLAIKRSPENRPVTIADGESTSNVIDIENAAYGGIFADASFDGASLTWEAAYTERGADRTDPSTFTWFDVTDGSGAAVTTTIGSGDYAPLSPYLFGARFLRATSNTSQSGDGLLTIVLKG